jgi:toxin secretion/phage lysis holin
MIFNILDWITGSLKAIKTKTLSSDLGIKGLIKKLGNWVVIGIAFSFSSMFVIIGDKVLNINLSIMYSLGWFTFVLLIINEILSILENLVALNVKVPNILIKSLKVTDNVLDNVSEKILDIDSEKCKNNPKD